MKLDEAGELEILKGKWTTQRERWSGSSEWLKHWSVKCDLGRYYRQSGLPFMGRLGKTPWRGKPRFAQSQRVTAKPIEQFKLKGWIIFISDSVSELNWVMLQWNRLHLVLRRSQLLLISKAGGDIFFLLFVIVVVSWHERQKGFYAFRVLHF